MIELARQYGRYGYRKRRNLPCRDVAQLVWSARELQQAFRIEDATGQAVAYVYFRKDENEARQASVLTHERPGGSQLTSPSCPSCYPARPKSDQEETRDRNRKETMSEKLQAAVKDSIAAAQRSGLKSKGDIALLGTRACARWPASRTGNWIWPRWLRHSRMNGLLGRYGRHLSVADQLSEPGMVLRLAMLQAGKVETPGPFRAEGVPAVARRA